MKFLNNQIVPVKIAHYLHCIGYDYPSLFIYTESCIIVSNIAYGYNNYFLNKEIGMNQVFAPLWQECIDWFMVKHYLIINVSQIDNVTNEWNYSINGKLANEKTTYHEAREKAILEAIKQIENKLILEQYDE